MSDLPPPDTAQDDAPDMAAAELALGLLQGEERAAAIRRVLAEPGFARLAERWRLQLSLLFDLWPEVPAPNVLARVERSIDRSAGQVAAATPDPSVRVPSRVWPGLAALSSIAAVGLLIVLVTRPPVLPPAPAPRPTPHKTVVAAMPTLVASIDPEDAQAVPLTAIYDGQAGAIRLTQGNLALSDRSAELWVIPADGTPHSLGLLHTHGTTALTLSPANRARIAAGATLAVSLEPVGGSPTGAPTGPIVAKGAIATI